MVGAHAPPSHPTEGKLVLNEVKNTVVDRNATGDCLFQYLLYSRFVPVEIVKSERVWSSIDEAQSIVDHRIFNYRQDRPKDLFLHHSHKVVCTQNERRGKKSTANRNISVL